MSFLRIKVWHLCSLSRSAFMQHFSHFCLQQCLQGLSITPARLKNTLCKQQLKVCITHFKLGLACLLLTLVPHKVRAYYKLQCPLDRTIGLQNSILFHIIFSLWSSHRPKFQSLVLSFKALFELENFVRGTVFSRVHRQKNAVPPIRTHTVLFKNLAKKDLRVDRVTFLLKLSLLVCLCH